MTAAAAFDALGEPIRRHILEVLSVSEQPAGSIVEAVRARRAISQPAVSQHLKVLRDADLVLVRADGPRRLYAINTAGVDAAKSWLAQLGNPMHAFAQPLDALATEVARGRRSRRSAQPRQARRSG